MMAAAIWFGSAIVVHLTYPMRQMEGSPIAVYKVLETSMISVRYRDKAG